MTQPMHPNYERPIRSIEMNGDWQSHYTVGNADITKIEPYFESGEMAGIVWFAIYINDVLVHRVNNRFVSCVTYAADQ